MIIGLMALHLEVNLMRIEFDLVAITIKWVCIHSMHIELVQFQRWIWCTLTLDCIVINMSKLVVMRQACIWCVKVELQSSGVMLLWFIAKMAVGRTVEKTKALRLCWGEANFQMQLLSIKCLYPQVDSQPTLNVHAVRKSMLALYIG